MDMLHFFDTAHPEIGREIEENKALTEELTIKIIEAAKEYIDRIS